MDGRMCADTRPTYFRLVSSHARGACLRVRHACNENPQAGWAGGRSRRPEQSVGLMAVELVWEHHLCSMLGDVFRLTLRLNRRVNRRVPCRPTTGTLTHAAKSKSC